MSTDYKADALTTRPRVLIRPRIVLFLFFAARYNFTLTSIAFHSMPLFVIENLTKQKMEFVKIGVV